MSDRGARPPQRPRQIGTLGTVSRAVTGTVLLLRALNARPRRADAVLGLVVVPSAVSAAVRLRASRRPEPIRATGLAGHVANLASIVAFFAAAPPAASLFYGTSLLVATARGYGACEMLAISNWLFDRDDQVGCPVFFPIDHLNR